MVNYQLGKIYKIVDNTNGNIYIGSTCEQYLSNRLGGHTKSYRAYLNGTHGKNTSFEIIKNGDYEIVLIESYPCDDKMQLHARERHYIETLECVNRYHPTRSKREYYQENKDVIKQIHQNYYNEHKDDLISKQKEYYIENKETISQKKKEYAIKNKDAIITQRKQFRTENRESINDKKREHWNANKDAINERRRQLYKLKKEQQQNILEA